METTNLTGKLLVAMPGMGDPRFERAVLLICTHDGEGAMGLMVNKPAPQLSFHDLLTQLQLPCETAAPRQVHFGGPVEGQRGFVLHSRDYAGDASTLAVDETTAMTATLDILRDIAGGTGPAHALVALGYAGWSPGQVEGEIAANGWLVVDPTPELVFGADNDAKWMAAIRALGIDPLLLSGAGGRA
ncbi:YqgE/AlgH family protein [Palleronia pontilimi]|nr:YqgE/AlgH family protein [Palleronia pontilimi]